MDLTLAHIPKLSESIFYTQKDDKHLFLNQDRPDWLVLNENSAYIVSLIDGIKSIEDIYQELKTNYSFDDLEKIIELFENLRKHHIIDDDKKDCSNFTCNMASKPKLHIVHLQLTNDCNLSCKYCYAESGKGSDKKLSFSDIKKVIDDIEDIASNVAYTITGGEPLLNPNALDIIEYLYQKKKEIFLLTNGLLISEENASFLAKTCVQIKISIDGSCEEVNALTRGKGSFQKALDGYNLLRKNGANVYIAMVVTQANKHDIQNMVNLFGNRLTLQPFFKAGRGIENEELQITGSEYYNTMASVEGLQPLGRIGELLNRLRNHGTTKCAMADGEIYISENGDVYPCQMLMEDEFKGGNIYTHSINEILNSKTFQKLATFSSLKNSECKECPIRLLCGGTCRARSYLDTGSVFKNSAFCEYEQLAYINGIFEASKFDTLR